MTFKETDPLSDLLFRLGGYGIGFVTGIVTTHGHDEEHYCQKKKQQRNLLICQFS